MRYTSSDGLPYVTWPWQRQCRARLEPNPGGYWGRCDLRCHPDGTEHALERGMLVVRWAVLLRVENP